MPTTLTRRTTRVKPVRTAACTVLSGIALLAGCASDPGPARPVLQTSAVEAALHEAPADGPPPDVEFFDALGSAPLVCHDDVLYTGLLLSNTVPGPTYPDRLAAARAQGLVERTFDRPAHEAATIGEVSKVLARIADGPGTGGSLSQDRAVSRLVTRGWLPVQARAYQGLTGAQLVTLAGDVREDLAARGSHPVARADPDFPAQPRPEPLPAAILHKPEIVANTPPAPAVPLPAEPVKPSTKPDPWVKGTPLKKPVR
jgi:hypothetical protein